VVGEQLEIHSWALGLAGEVVRGAGLLGLGHGAVEQQAAARIGAGQRFLQVGREGCQQFGCVADVAKHGRDADTEARRKLRQSVVFTQVDQGAQGTLGGAELAGAVTLPSEDDHRNQLNEVRIDVDCGRIGDQRGYIDCELDFDIPTQLPWGLVRCGCSTKQLPRVTLPSYT
jgi:hypothetical protein